MHDMAEESSCGTCLMSDGRYETLPLDKLAWSFKRFRDQSYLLPLPQRSELREMYNTANADKEKLEEHIAKSQSQLKQSLEEASLVRSAQREAAESAKKEENAKAPKKKSTLRDITLGTKVTIYCEWADLDANLRKVGPLGKGQWLGGNVINIVKENRK
jgi:hypothetical protein